VLAEARACRYLLIAGADDVWSRGAADIADELTARGRNHVTVRIRPGGHEFPAADRELAYEFLASARLNGARSGRDEVCRIAVRLAGGPR
jgi:predicted esterase